MKNALQRFGYTCVSAMIAAGLSGAMFAQTLNRITVNLPQDVEVGSNILRAGAYTIQDLESASGEHVFVFRGETGKAVIVQADRIEQMAGSDKTELILSRDGFGARLHKLFVEGSPIGYEFSGDAAEIKHK